MKWVGLSCFASNWVLQFPYLQCSLEDEARKDSIAWTLYYCLPTSAHHPSLLGPLGKIWPRGTFRPGRPVIALLLLVHSVNSLAQTRFSLYGLLSVPDPLVLCCFDAVSFFLSFFCCCLSLSTIYLTSAQVLAHWTSLPDVPSPEVTPFCPLQLIMCHPVQHNPSELMLLIHIYRSHFACLLK